MSGDINPELPFLSQFGKEVSLGLQVGSTNRTDARRLVESHEGLTELDCLWIRYVLAERPDNEAELQEVSRELYNSGEPYLVALGTARLAEEAMGVIKSSSEQIAKCRQLVALIAEQFSAKNPPPKTFPERWLFLVLDSLAVLEAISAPPGERRPTIANEISRLEEILTDAPDFFRLTRAVMKVPPA